MMKRGPKSLADLSTVTPIADARPQPPDDLTSTQVEIWRGIVNRLPQDWFPRETHDLLATYCRHVTSVRFLTRMVEACQNNSISTETELKDYDRCLAMRERESRALVATARALRITKASQTRPETAYRGAANASMLGKRPWDT